MFFCKSEGLQETDGLVVESVIADSCLYLYFLFYCDYGGENK